MKNVCKFVLWCLIVYVFALFLTDDTPTPEEQRIQVLERRLDVLTGEVRHWMPKTVCKDCHK